MIIDITAFMVFVYFVNTSALREGSVVSVCTN